MRRLDSSLFDWLTWRAGSICDVFGIAHRGECIIAARRRMAPRVVGWCPAEQLPCRPKTGYVAVMFHVAGRDFWTHVTPREFESMQGHFLDNNEVGHG